MRGDRSSRAGFTLLEVVIVAAILSVAMVTIGGAMLTTQHTVATAVTMQDATGQARRAADAVMAELRNANMVATDIQPDVPSNATSFEYRVVDGWDSANSRVLLAPTRASGNFRRLYLSQGSVLRDVPGIGLTTLASQVSDLRITFDGTDRLTIFVEVTRTDSKGETFTATATAVLLVRNKLTSAT